MSQVSLQDILQRAIARVEPNNDGTYTFYISLKLLLSGILSNDKNTANLKINRIVISSPYIYMYVDMTSMLSPEVKDIVDMLEGKFTISIAKIQARVSIPVDFMQNSDDVLMVVRISNAMLQTGITTKQGGSETW